MPRIQAGSIQLNYDISGEGDPLLLIMGFGMSGQAWVPMLPMMQGFKCIYFDNRGTGLSDQPEGPYTAAQMADDASALLTALDIPKARVYGVSMGGMIAQELTLRHPEQVVKLVLGCTTAGGAGFKQAPPEVGEQLMTGVKLMASDPDQAYDIIMPLLYPPEFIAANPELKDLMLAMAKASPVPPTPPETADRAMAGLADFNAYDRLAQIECPVLIVHGEKDVLIPVENAHTIKSRIPQAELYLIPEAGHGYQAADPIGVHQRITDWLKQ